jgi:hypothetical protein
VRIIARALKASVGELVDEGATLDDDDEEP